MVLTRRANLVNFVSLFFGVPIECFMQLCILTDPVLVIPAVFLIGLQGAPLEVIGGAVEKVEIITRANKALELLNKEANPSPQPVTKCSYL